MNTEFRSLFEEKNLRNLATEIFLYNLEKLKNNPVSYIKSSEIFPIDKTDAIYEETTETIDNEAIVPEIKKVVVIKLNGGLGTSMGLEGAKSQLIVKNNLNFLEITCKQVERFREKHNVDLPLIFMNSFKSYFHFIFLILSYSKYSSFVSKLIL